MRNGHIGPYCLGVIMFKRILGAAAAAFFSVSTMAQATTLTFDQITFGSVVESGYAYQNTSTYSTPGALTLHDDVGGQRLAGFSKTNGGLFNAVQVDMTGFGNVYQTGTQSKLDAANNRVISYTDYVFDTQLNLPNFSWSGYRGGQLVANDQGSLANWFTMGTYSFGSAFQSIDQLVLRLLMPNIGYQVVNFTYGLAPNTVFCLAYCGSVAIDNLQLSDAQPSPVPLPAGFGLLGAGVLALGLIGRRKRSIA